MKNFDAGKLPGLVASWSFDAIEKGAFASAQKDIPAIPSVEATVESGRIQNAARFAKDALVVPLKLKEKIGQTFTVAFWIKSDPNPDGNLININDLFFFSLDMVQGSLRFNAQGQWFYGGTNNASMLGYWTHFAITSDATTLSVYGDGHLLLSMPVSRSLELSDSFKLGGSGFKGLIDDLQIFDRAFDGETVQHLYLSPPRSTD